MAIVAALGRFAEGIPVSERFGHSLGEVPTYPGGPSPGYGSDPYQEMAGSFMMEEDLPDQPASPISTGVCAHTSRLSVLQNQ